MSSAVALDDSSGKWQVGRGGQRIKKIADVICDWPLTGEIDISVATLTMTTEREEVIQGCHFQII